MKHCYVDLLNTLHLTFISMIVPKRKKGHNLSLLPSNSFQKLGGRGTNRQASDISVTLCLFPKSGEACASPPCDFRCPRAKTIDDAHYRRNGKKTFATAPFRLA